MFPGFCVTGWLAPMKTVTWPTRGAGGGGAETYIMPDAHKESMNAMVGRADQELPKDNCKFGMHCAVGDPVLLRQGGGRVNLKLVRVPQEGRCCLHLDCIVACRVSST